MAWDATMRTVENKTDEEMAHIVYTRFTSGDTKEGIKYSLGGLYVRKVVTRVSHDALNEILQKKPKALVNEDGVNGIDYKKLNGVKLEITREHIIPVLELYSHLEARYREGTLTEAYILQLMPTLEIALISKEEDQKLRDALLTKSMPKGWWEKPDRDPLDRYRAAGLPDAIWVTEFPDLSK